MEIEREEEEKRENGCLRFGAQKGLNPYKSAAKRQPNQNKTRVQNLSAKK